MRKEKKAIKSKSIKRQLIGKYMGIMILASCILCTVSIAVGRSAVTKNSKDLLQVLAKQTANDINDIIELEKKNIELIAKAPIITDDKISRDKKIAYLNEIVEEYGYKKDRFN